MYYVVRIRRSIRVYGRVCFVEFVICRFIIFCTTGVDFAYLFCVSRATWPLCARARVRLGRIYKHTHVCVSITRVVERSGLNNAGTCFESDCANKQLYAARPVRFERLHTTRGHGHIFFKNVSSTFFIIQSNHAITEVGFRNVLELVGRAAS